MNSNTHFNVNEIPFESKDFGGILQNSVKHHDLQFPVKVHPPIFILHENVFSSFIPHFYSFEPKKKPEKIALKVIAKLNTSHKKTRAKKP